MILLKSELAAALDVGGVDAVRQALHSAIKLEHATIPLYLYALYSLDESLNGDIAEIIQSVAVEEMLHLTLACNILNALNGTPKLDAPDFIPTYPGPLPGGVESQLRVQLAPFSLAQLETFLTIEEPADPLDIRVAAVADAPLTIGQFYQRIGVEITKLKPSDFAPTARHQIGPDQMDESLVVTDIPSALRAINIIIDQGEGTSKSPLEQVGHDYAHYYRYQQIQKGRRLIPAPGETPPWVFGGDPLVLDPKGVYAVPTNPSRKLYPVGSAARIACDTFNYDYTSLLKSLNATFNGQSHQLNAAIGLMMSLKSQAKAMMSGSPNPGVLAGPSFEYQPTNP